jgi:hypothetical protein
MADWGEIYIRVVQRDDAEDWRDPILVVDRADPTAGVSASLLTEGRLVLNDDGYFVVGEQPAPVVYRPVRFAEGGRVIVCERVS